ncbi:MULTISPECIES: DNA recombination protein RmuC [unclassified Colwellia]|uniref:DNA recombination protein RmuC n=1 Tax=unclassified Colwellia TaxID=196834 RepID=UPI002174E034|nr:MULTISPECIES: DNA recombination protein RmuC [unclassified Colwellia]
MTELMLQTLLFSSITLIAGVVFFKVINKQQTLTPVPDQTERCDELLENVALLETQIYQHVDEKTSLKEQLAGKSVAIEHLTKVADELDSQKQSNSTQAQVLTELKTDQSKLSTQVDEKNIQLQQLRQSLSAEQSKTEHNQVTLQKLSNANAEQFEKLNQLEVLRKELENYKTAVASKDLQISELKVTLSADKEAKKAQQEKLELLERSEQRLVKEFENTANKIFKEKTGEMTTQNKTSLDALLTPLKNQIGDFSKKVTDVYTEEAKERHALKQEVHSLKALNEQMGKEATALTKALKGDNKKQGTWGEVVLERVLQSSGLRKNHEYDTQVDLKDIEGASFKPDVIVHLPGDKDVVIDSKMALTAYERYYNEDDEIACQQALKEHISSIKNHIKQLTSKNYQDLHGIKTLDYVLMFIPVEPAFNAAIEHDSELIQLALENNIMLVSPTNLMVALKTINNMWRVEYQNQNAQDIAIKAGAIYDKLVGFVDDMKKLGNHLERAEGSYGDAMKKLSEGRGNLIRKAEDMKGLRISNNKSLPVELVEKSEIKNLVANG